MDIPMELSRILITEMGEQQVIFLREKDGERTFPILIGTNEALAIDRWLSKQLISREKMTFSDDRRIKRKFFCPTDEPF